MFRKANKYNLLKSKRFIDNSTQLAISTLSRYAVEFPFFKTELCISTLSLLNGDIKHIVDKHASYGFRELCVHNPNVLKEIIKHIENEIQKLKRCKHIRPRKLIKEHQRVNRIFKEVLHELEMII